MGKQEAKNAKGESRSQKVHAFLTALNYTVLVLFGAVEDFFSRLFYGKQKQEKGYADLNSGFEDFFNRRMFYRSWDCWNRPIASAPGAWFDVLDRKFETDPKRQKPATGRFTLSFTGEAKRCLNLGSYNYLGFGDNEQICNNEVIQSMRRYGVATCSPSAELGTTPVHKAAEASVARLLGKEDAIIYGMGFATNTTSIPSLIGKGDLVISDTLNHCSIVVGARSSGATIVTFKHDDMNHLEDVIRTNIAKGQPKTHKPYRKAVIVVEGVYSMEGEILNLPAIVNLKNKYKCYLYVDEAHSIGALGKFGGGVCQYWGVDPNEVDILMGTFTKSFASVGGYIAANKNIIDCIRKSSWGNVYATSMSIPCAQQIISSTTIILGEDGTDIGAKKIAALRENSNFFRRKLIEKGFQVLGSEDSPVIPIMIYYPSKTLAFSRELLKRNIGAVVVGYPATPLFEARARLCISSAHTRKDLEMALEAIDQTGDLLMIKYSRPSTSRSSLKATTKL